ncbi:MAG: tRNA (adenosine(37)-N6)-dimethylallyltransferase MiaA [Bacteroidales bacterium]|nr:tRNA (adenosine(37)-N6)-dimethylallyltransferase MiaA [Bacteroidales bacterium]
MTKNSNKFNLIVVLGPTATGKTSFAAHLANAINSEIISADSRQVYRHMNLGTGKDYSDYIVNGKIIPCHLIDIREPGTKYNIFEYQNDFFQVYKNLINKGITPILCGGTGLYIESIVKQYKLIAVPVNEKLRAKLSDKTLEELEQILSNYKILHNRTDTDTLKRALRAIEIEEYYKSHPDLSQNFPEIKPVYIGISTDRETRRQNITERLHKRIANGMIEEVKFLLQKNISPDDLIYYGLEYKYITLHLVGKLSYEEMVKKLNAAIHQFAKRQMTWFRKMEREDCNIHWIDTREKMEIKLATALSILGRA